MLIPSRKRSALAMDHGGVATLITLTEQALLYALIIGFFKLKIEARHWMPLVVAKDQYSYY